MSFDREFDKAAKEIEDALEKTVRGASIELFGEIVRRTPVGNSSLWASDPPAGYIGGRLRANWQADINSPPQGEIDTPDGNGSSTTSRGTSEISKYTLNDKSIWFSNNLPYAERVENGWSSQAPQGMMRTTVKIWQSAIDKNARRNKK